MSILNAVMVPHPPLILPEVGRGEEKKIQATTDACREAARFIFRAGPDTVVITTPHSAGSPASPVCGVLLPAEGCCEDALCPRSGRGLSEASGFCPLPLSELPELLEVSELAELSELELPELFELLSSGSVGFSSSVGASS